MKKVLDYIQQNNLITKGDHVVTGVSGGADSVCLLFLLKEISEVLDFTVSAVHINHNLRGEEAKRDELFTEQLCHHLGVPLKIYHYPVADIAREKKLSTEEAGRLVRYEAFEDFCNQRKGTKIALAHHQNDLAETMIYHLTRGTDLAGLSAMRSKRDKYIRPLLCMNRSEIEHYLKVRNIQYVTDSTNEEDVYTRNKIRHHVVDYLEQEINVQAVSHMAETSQSLGDIQDFLAELYQNAFHQYAKVEEYKIFLDEKLFQENKVLVRGVICQAVQRLVGSLKDVGRVHIRSIYELAYKGVGRKISLPYNLAARKEYQGLSISLIREEVREERPDAVKINIPGITFFEKYKVICEFETESMEKIPEKTYTKWLDYDRIGDSLEIRFRQSGDYLVINREGGKKKLKDYFINEKVAKEDRDQIPLLCCGSHVAWVYGHRISEHFKVDKASERIVKIQILPYIGIVEF